MTIILPYPVTSQAPTEFKVDSAGNAIALLAIARGMCMGATYLPNGGETAKANFPITHSVYVVGTEEQLAALRRTLAKRSENQ